MHSPEMSSRNSQYKEIAKRIIEASFTNYHILPENTISSDPELIYRCLEPDKFFRIGDNPTGEPLARNIEIVAKSVLNNEPVPLFSVIGTSRSPDGKPSEFNRAGLPELLMFEVLKQLTDKVESCYIHGATVVLIIEDASNQWLYSQEAGNLGVSLNNESYTSSLRQLLKKYQENNSTQIKILSETGILQQMGVSLSDYYLLCELNQAIFARYLKETRNIDRKLSNHSSLPSYQALVSKGWSDGISPEMEDYYRNRFRNSNKNIKNEDGYLAAYFAVILAKKMLRLALQANRTSAIKLAFVDYPPGTPLNLNSAIKLAVNKRSGKNHNYNPPPPWRAVPYVIIREYKNKTKLVMLNSDYNPKDDNNNKHIVTSVFPYGGIFLPYTILVRD
jgi:hypothetical protein